jgi:hypothetical protein
MKRSVGIALMILSLILVLTSVYLPVPVYSQTELAQVNLGLPLPFLIQNQEYYPPSFPWQTSIRSVWENPIQVLWPQFFLNIVFVFGLLSLVLNLVKSIFLRASGR